MAGLLVAGLPRREYEFRSASGTPCVEPPLMCRCNLLADGKSEPPRPRFDALIRARIV